MRGAAVAVLLLAGVAAAEPVVVLDGARPWRVELPDGFTAGEAPELDEGGILASWRDGRGRQVMVGKLRGHGGDAGEREWAARIEEGTKRETRGYRRLEGKRRTVGGRPAYDLWFRAGADVRGARFVALRGYFLVLAVHAPETRRIDRDLRRAVESFSPVPEGSEP